MPTIKHAIFYSAINKYLMSIIGLATTIMIARLLTPSEIGVYAIASAVVMLLSEIRILGAGVYIIREPNLKKSQIRSALGLTILISWTLGAILFATSPYISEFYEIDAIKLIFWILSFGFILAPFVSIPAALLSKNYNFDKLFYIRLISSLSIFTSTFIFIKLELSFYGLALANTISMIAQVIATYYFVRKEMVWKPRFKDLKPIVSVGIYSSAANILERTQKTLPDIVIGKTNSTTNVAIFSRGLGFIDFLSELIISGVKPVALPFLSNVLRDGGDVTQAYIKATKLLGAFTWPVLAVASVASLPTIRLFFGDQWDSAAPIASVLAFWSIIRSIHGFAQPLLLTLKLEVSLIIKEIIAFFTYAALIIYSSQFGLMAIAWALLIAAFIDFCVTTLIIKTKTNLGILTMLKEFLPNFLLVAICWSVAYSLEAAFNINEMHYVSGLLIYAAVLPILWIFCLRLLKHPLFDELLKLIKLNKLTQ
ncbi:MULTISPECIES: oligosaccharide flippase family protein [Marinobacter]|uniref:oligosaccharide flippase family protein n=1 Tax=Marinobacter TaxID=2742 RepID=UPI003008892B